VARMVSAWWTDLNCGCEGGGGYLLGECWVSGVSIAQRYQVEYGVSYLGKCSNNIIKMKQHGLVCNYSGTVVLADIYISKYIGVL
jgi:hypothetical protein